MAEGAPLLREYGVYSLIEGSNPSVSAIFNPKEFKMTLETLMIFFGWMALINIGVLFFSTITTALFRKSSHKLHSALFKITPDEFKNNVLNLQQNLINSTP